MYTETVAGKPVDFRKTRFYDSARQSEAESTNEKNGGNEGRDDGAAFFFNGCKRSWFVNYDW